MSVALLLKKGGQDDKHRMCKIQDEVNTRCVKKLKIQDENNTRCVKKVQDENRHRKWQ